MAARIWGGIAGWLVAILPLLAVNALEYFGIYYFPDPVLAGLAALVIGLALGGIVAALVGKRRGGMSGAAISGVLAAVLYSVSLIGLLFAARSLDALPSLITEHPLRVSAGILFFAALMLLASLVTGALTSGVSSEAEPAAAYPPRAPLSASAPRRRPPNSYPGAPGGIGTSSMPAAPSRPVYGPPSGTQGRIATVRDGATRPHVHVPQQPHSPQPVRGPQPAPNPPSPRNDRSWR